MCCYDPDHEVMVTVGGSEAIDIGSARHDRSGRRGADPAAELCVLHAMLSCWQTVSRLSIELEEKDQLQA